MWFTIKRFINNNAEYLAETLLFLIAAYIATLLVHRLFVGPFGNETERRHGELTAHYELRLARLLDDPAYPRRRFWRKVRAAFVWLIFLAGVVPWIVTRQQLIY
ncbi:hypothetical protein GV829_03045 [Sphingomonas lacunae]|uniref:Uncharacterized protein n=1 Tax=Sphingomonas lacunae TaxID=2698828 RepID=A0A6M4AR76_9SPHN|nr:hypothetical protein [Sphingomonas lacunae]QJQ31547.1 hypothetical protein GV829_03045 [Sphingomonas lacunae]